MTGLIVRLVILAVIIVSCAGCAATPEFEGDCATLFETAAEVTKCEHRVMSRENVRFRRAENKREQAACLSPMVWQDNGSGTGKCVDPFEIWGL